MFIYYNVGTLKPPFKQRQVYKYHSTTVVVVFDTEFVTLKNGDVGHPARAVSRADSLSLNVPDDFSLTLIHNPHRVNAKFIK